MATLLIVEDDRKTNEAICEYLKSAGHMLISAYDGAAALQSFDECNIDLIVLDIMLPKISGLSVLHEIRQKSSVSSPHLSVSHVCGFYGFYFPILNLKCLY